MRRLRQRHDSEDTLGLYFFNAEAALYGYVNEPPGKSVCRERISGQLKECLDDLAKDHTLFQVP